MKEIKLLTFMYAAYKRWPGPANMRSFHLHVLRKDLEIALAEYVVERKRVAK